MDEEQNYCFGINPILEKLKASPNDIFEILIARGSSAPAYRKLPKTASLSVTCHPTLQGISLSEWDSEK